MANETPYHLCFGKIGEPKHEESHICFGKRLPATLEPLEAAGCVSVLEDAITKLQVIAQTIPFDKNSTDEETNYAGLEDRFSKPVVEPDEYKNKEFFGVRAVDALAMIKLQKDRMFAQKILHKTLEDLRDCQHFAALRGAMALQAALVADEKAVAEKLREARNKQAALRDLLATERELMVKQNVFWDQKEEELLAAYHDTRLISGLTLQFVRKWEETRRDQLHQMTRSREDGIRNEIEDVIENSVVQEERAHMEIKNFLLEEHAKLKNELDHWTDVYDEQMSTREAEISHLRTQKEGNLEGIASIQAEMDRRRGIMAEALVLRDIADKRKYAMKQVQIIQSWWRGVFFRKNLAPKADKIIRDLRSTAKKARKLAPQV